MTTKGKTATIKAACVIRNTDKTDKNDHTRTTVTETY